MIVFMKKLKNHPFSLLLIAVIWVACFIDVPETPLSDVALIDKWTHTAMYAVTCSVIWVEYLYCHRGKGVKWSHVTLWIWLVPVMMSGAIELLQAYCTGGRRSGEWLDFLANAIGCSLPFLIGAAYVLRANACRKNVS